VRRLAWAVTVAVLVVWPAAAGAHEEITPNTIVTGAPTFFTLSAANESKADLVKVTVAAPQGTAFGETTRDPAGWTAQKSESRITWSGGTVKPEAFEQWGFEIEGADQAGTIDYSVTLAYADGKSDDVKVPVVARAPGATNGTVLSGANVVTLRRAKSRASTALLLGWVALGVAVVALLLALLRPTSTRPRAQQDW